MRPILLLLAASALALPAPGSSASLPASLKVFAEQTVFQPSPTTTRTKTRKAKSTKTTEASESATSASPSPSADASPLPSHTTPKPDSNADAATPTNSIPPSVTPQSVKMSATGIPGLKVVTEVVTVTASPAGEENGAKVYFPNTLNHWVLHALSVIEWAPALPVPVDIRLTNPDPEVLLYDYILSMNVPAGFSSLALSVMEPASAGTGYQLIVADHDNGTIYSTSEMFEIKKEGSSVLVPAGFAAATQSGGIIAQASGAGRATWWSTALLTCLATLWL